MKKLTTRDLFVSHIIRTLLLRHIYIKLSVTEDGTVISFGSDESCDDGIFPDHIGSQLVFDGEDDELWEETMDLAYLRDELIKFEDIVLSLSEDGNELMIEVKVEVPFPEEPVSQEKIAHSKSEIIEYVYTHKRTILAVEVFGFPCSGYIMTDVCGLYMPIDKYCCGYSESYQISIDDIESLDRSTFNVFELYEGIGVTVYEITNKLL